MRRLVSSGALGLLAFHLLAACSGDGGEPGGGAGTSNGGSAASGGSGSGESGGNGGTSSKGGSSSSGGAAGKGGSSSSGGAAGKGSDAGAGGEAGDGAGTLAGAGGSAGDAGGSGAPGDSNTPPTISALEDLVIEMDASTGEIAFTIGDAETPADALVVTKLSSNEDLVRTVEDITLGGTGAERTLTVTPLSVFGVTTITLTVSDGEADSSESFELTVNSPPFIEVQPDVGTVMGYALAPFELSITDDLTATSEVLVSASSDNQTLLPDANIAIAAGSEADHRKFTLTLAPGQFGEANVTITAEDEHGSTRERTFKVTVLEESVNQAELVSRSSEPDSVIGDAYSGVPSLSGDGRFVAYQSAASNITELGGYYDVYVWDRTNEVVERATAGLGYNVNAAISADGKFVAFVSDYKLVAADSAGTWDVYVYDVEANTLEQVSVSDGEAQGNGSNVPVGFSPFDASYRPAISGDGRYVAFVSQSSNLVANDDNGKADVFVRDRTVGTTTRISVSSNGTQADADSTQVAISGDGSVVAFASTAKNLVDGSTDPDAYSDVFVRAAGATSRVSLNPTTSAPGNGSSDQPAVSGDGSVVAYVSAANNLVSGDTLGQSDVFVYRLADDVVERVSVSTDGDQANGYSGGPSLSQDGRYVVFDSLAESLTGANNFYVNVYVRDRTDLTTTLVNRSYTGALATGGSYYTSFISADGNFITFQTAASNIFLADDNNASDVFVVPRP